MGQSRITSAVSATRFIAMAVVGLPLALVTGFISKSVWNWALIAVCACMYAFGCWLLGRVPSSYQLSTKADAARWRMRFVSPIVGSAAVLFVVVHIYSELRPYATVPSDDPTMTISRELPPIRGTVPIFVLFLTSTIVCDFARLTFAAQCLLSIGQENAATFARRLIRANQLFLVMAVLGVGFMLKARGLRSTVLGAPGILVLIAFIGSIIVALISLLIMRRVRNLAIYDSNQPDAF